MTPEPTPDRIHHDEGFFSTRINPDAEIGYLLIPKNDIGFPAWMHQILDNLGGEFHSHLLFKEKPRKSQGKDLE
jgi:hypothetical protein